MGHATRILMSGLFLAAQIDAGANRSGFSAADISLLDDLSYRAFLYFNEQTDPKTGLTFDRTLVNGKTTYKRVASIAATGFALTSYRIGQAHHWIDHREAERAVRRTLAFFIREAPHKSGWFYHFMYARIGERILESSPTHPISGTTWDQWRMPIETEGGYTFIGEGPLFICQYSLAWLHLRDRFAPDPSRYFHANYLLNARFATRAQREAFVTQLANRFHGYSEDTCGLTSSDSPHGYLDWGRVARRSPH